MSGERRSLTPRERNIAIVTGVVLGGAALFLGLLEPAWKSWSDLRAEVEGLELALEQDQDAQARLVAVYAERRALDDLLQADDELGTVPGFIAHVRQVSQAAGFTPTALRFVRAKGVPEAPRPTRGQTAPRPAFAELEFEIQARVPLGQLQDFLVRLAADPRPVRVGSLGVSPRDDGRQVEVSVTLLALAPAEALDQIGGGR